MVSLPLADNVDTERGFVCPPSGESFIAMTIAPIEERQVRPCIDCAFFVYLTNDQVGRCNLWKGERKGTSHPRWEIEDETYLPTWPCSYHVTPHEIETSPDDPWVRSVIQESLRFYNSAHRRRDITESSRKRTGRRSR